MIGRYQTARAFRAALEDRLKQLARAQGIDLMRLRRQIAFDRLLVRLFAEPDSPWLLKGGYAFELRWDRAARRVSDALKLFCMHRYGMPLEPPFGTPVLGPVASPSGRSPHLR